MKTINSIIIVLFLSVFFNSCDEDEKIIVTPAETLNITNLHAPSDVRDRTTGEIITINDFVYFDFSSGQLVEETEDWDLGFKGTVLITNGGVNGTGDVSAAILTNTFDEVTEAPSDAEFKQDTELENAIPSGSGEGWYNYTPTNHLISPIPGKIFVFKTVEGNYVKMEILAYYQDSPANPDPLVDLQDYFSFNYAYQENGSKTF